MKSMSINTNLDINSLDDGRVSIFNPKTKKTFVLGEKEYNILINLNGVNTIDDLESKSDYDKEKIIKLINTFGKLKLLANADVKVKQSILKITIGIINPNKYIKPDMIIVKLIYFLLLYITPVLFISGLLCNIGKGNFIVDILQSFQSPVFLIVIPITLFVTFLHEVGHLFVARYYGVNVPEMGIMLYWFMPAAFVNLSGTAFLNSKRKRIIIFSSGLMMNLFISSIALLIRPIVSGEFQFLFSWIFADNLLNILFNLFIFLKLDGYLIFKELVEVKNLREISTNYIVTNIKKILTPNSFGKLFKVESVKDIKESTRFQCSLYIIFGLLVILFIPIFLLSLIFAILSYFI